MLSKKAKRREEARQQEARQTTEDSATSAQSAHALTPADHKRTGAKAFFNQHYKRLMLIPTLMLILTFCQIGYQMATTGDFVQKSVSLQGGTMITVLEELDVPATEQPLTAQFPDGHIRVRETAGITVIESVYTDSAQVKQLVTAVRAQTGIAEGKYTVEIVGTMLGESFFRQTMIALLIAFCFISIVVFVSFRSIVPSLFVILAAGSDILSTLAIFNLTGQELSTAGIAAFLMLIGYSIDTDVMLTSRVLKRREGSVTDATFGAIATGLTMSITTIGATTVGLLLTKSDVLWQIMFIIAVGVTMDILYTWLYNAPILKWYLERKGITEVRHG